MARGKRSVKRTRKDEDSPVKSSPAKRVKTGEESEAVVPAAGEEKKDANPDSFPIFDGKVMHLCIQRGDIANRIVICEDSWRAWKLARYFDNPNKCIYIHSPRHFECYTGLFQGVPITVIASGMGTPMIDFAIREGKFCVDGPIAISRFGSCCSINKDVKVGNVVLASKGAFNVQTDYDLLHDSKKKGLPYKISSVTKPD
jgi:uridine phosphorylase